MKKLLLALSLLCCSATALQASYPNGYYDRMDGKKKEALKAAAKECVSNHQKLVYKDLPTYWQYTDVYEDLYNGCKRWWDMYSDNIYLIQSYQTASSSFSANSMQREHAVPKSWWKKDGDVEYTPAYSDMWNLYPSDGPANQAKLNYPLGECRTTTFDNGVTKVGIPVTGQGGGCGNVFEPADEYKGDFARAFFYMAVVYDDLPWVVNYMYDADSPWPTLRSWAVNMLLQWSRRDPVSQKEIMRNEGVQNAQGNRNPFVDFPELAEYIWGTRTSETFLIADQGGNVTPPITGDPELTAPVNGEALDFGEVAVTQSTSAPLHVSGANLTGPLSVRIIGADKDMFAVSVSSISAADINQGTGFLLNVIYTPTEEGEHEASLMLYDGGLPVSQNVSVKLIGKAFPIPSLSTLKALDASDVTETSYMANWELSNDVIDYYVVHRVRYYEDGPEADEVTTDVNYYVFADRDPGVTETYYVQSSRLGYLSPQSNVITVAGAGVSGIAAAQPLAVAEVPGGFVVLLDSVHTGLCVYDMSGRLVADIPEVSGGETCLLPPGVYIVVTDQSRRPLRLLVK